MMSEVNQAATNQADISQLMSLMESMQARTAELVKAIHGTHSSLARVQSSIRKQPPHCDHMTPMDDFYGIPFIEHDSEVNARESAWKQALQQRCKVLLVEHDKYFEIDGAAMARMLESQQSVDAMFRFTEPIQFSEPTPYRFKGFYS